jgi:hypothetical protein
MTASARCGGACGLAPAFSSGRVESQLQVLGARRPVSPNPIVAESIRAPFGKNFSRLQALHPGVPVQVVKRHSSLLPNHSFAAGFPLAVKVHLTGCLP